MDSVAKLNISNVSKKFFRGSKESFYAVQNISINISNGQFVTILGPSGCGKTTLLKIAAGLINPSEGAVFLNGNEIKGPNINCGLVPQAYTLFPWLNVNKNIEFGLKLIGTEKKRRDKLVNSLLELIGLEKYKNFYPKSLSGGMKQRVAIARTLAVEPEILLMDEPFGALDAQTRSLMQDNLLDIWCETKKTVLFVTHDIEEAIYLSDIIYVSSPLPGTIRKKISIDLPRPREFHMKTQSNFMNIKRSIVELLRKDSLKAFDTLYS